LIEKKGERNDYREIQILNLRFRLNIFMQIACTTKISRKDTDDRLIDIIAYHVIRYTKYIRYIRCNLSKHLFT